MTTTKNDVFIFCWVELTFRVGYEQIFGWWGGLPPSLQKGKPYIYIYIYIHIYIPRLQTCNIARVLND